MVNTVGAPVPGLALPGQGIVNLPENPGLPPAR